MAEKMHLSFIIFVMTGFIIFVYVNSTTHIVGDKLGWNLPGYNTYYEDWAKNRTFVVGDKLLFKYHPGLGTVLHVNKDDFGNCTNRNTIRTYFRGNSTVSLDKPGDYYFFCSVGKRCELGQKLFVKVSQGKTSRKTLI
ncbi:mavicyanin-like [Vicia villosa]|uniref:mavicyanin-like n=1 Tax=Vicia villosa TaxID=3911 RepID=UPI00273B1ADC|nr:mavicyanin-like [Vicia villosa]XP_058736008.1 mavicyanin-like [Vicia villosa]